MILDSNPIKLRDAPNGPAAPTSTRRAAGRNAPVANSPYSRVGDELEAEPRYERTEQTRSDNAAKKFSLWQDSQLGFGDFLDVINPLQHIPIVATIYRNLSGDQIGMAPRIIGGALWGRIGGLVAGVLNSLVEWFTGKDIGDHIYAAIWGKPNGQSTDNAAAQTAELELHSSAPTETEAPPASVPLSGNDSKVSESELHSAIAPASLITSQVLRSFYRRDDEREATDAKQSTVRLSV